MNWKLTQAIAGKPEIDNFHDADEDLTLGFSLLRALAEYDETLVEIQPGMWYQSKIDQVRES